VNEVTFLVKSLKDKHCFFFTDYISLVNKHCKPVYYVHAIYQLVRLQVV